VPVHTLAKASNRAWIRPMSEENNCGIRLPMRPIAT